MRRREFLLAAGGTAAALAFGGVFLATRIGGKTQNTSSTVTVRTRTGTSRSPRWVWCQPIRGVWQYPQYSQSDLFSALSKISFDVLHRGIDQGGDGSTNVFTNDASSIPTVKKWVNTVKGLGVKIIGRIPATISTGLDPRDPTLQSQLSSVPPIDMSNAGRQSLLANWGIRYYDTLGVDGTWYDIVSTNKLPNQTAAAWNNVYTTIHDHVESGYIMQTNSSASLIGERDVIETTPAASDVTNITDTMDWGSIRQEAASQNGGSSPPISMHLDFPSVMTAFQSLSLQDQVKYLDFVSNDSFDNNYIFEWPMLAGNPGGGSSYDAMASGTFDTIANIVNSL